MSEPDRCRTCGAELPLDEDGECESCALMREALVPDEVSE